MKFDYTQKNGTIKRIQCSFAPRKGTSTCGTPYSKDNAILHFSSSRSTGETWVFTVSDVWQINMELMNGPGEWYRPIDWDRELRAKTMTNVRRRGQRKLNKPKTIAK